MTASPGRVRSDADRPERVVGLVRPRLIELFTALPGPKRAAMAVAPAGHGKTTLLRQLAAAFGAGPVGWITCDRSDTAPGVFLQRMSAALGELLPDAASPAEVMARLEAGDHDPGLLVVDDAYALGDGASAEMVGHLLGPDVPGLSVLVGSRVALPTDLSRVRLDGGLVELGTEDLRFRAWEVEALLRDIYREPLGPEDVARLARKTQGWAACLQLFHLATRGKSFAERRAVLGTLDHRSHLVREFLTRNVLDQLPERLRDFLVQTSVMRRPTGALCDRLLERNGSARDLEELERRQLFTVRLDGELGYRYHEVLRSYCLAELVEAVGEAQVSARFVRAAELMGEAGDSEGAFVAYVSAGDRAGALRLLDEQGDALVGPATSLLDVLPPGWIDSDPWLSLARARQLVGAGRLGEASDVYASIARSGPPAAAEVAERERRALGAWTSSEPPTPGDGADWSALLRAGLRRDPDAAATALSRLPGPAARLAEAVVLGLGGRLTRARHVLEAAALDPAASPWVAAAGHVLSSLERAVSSDGRDGPELVLVVDSVEATALSRLAVAVANCVEPDPERAAAVTHQLAGGARRDGDAWGVALLEALAALGSWRRGDPDAPRALDSAASSLTGLGAEVPAAWLLTLAALVGAGPERLDAARAAASAARLPVALALLDNTPMETPRPTRDADRSAAGEPGRADSSWPFPPPVQPATTILVRCFGTFQLTVESHPADLSGMRPRTRALLLLLASYGGAAVHRDRLCDALWPRSDASSALRNLQVAVSELRQQLPVVLGRALPGVSRRGESYWLDLGGDVTYDVARFEAAVQRARPASGTMEVAALAEALILQPDPLLASEGAAQWVFERRDRLAEAGVWAALELSRRSLAEDQLGVARTACQLGLRLDPYRDELWKRQIRAAELAGDPAGAEKVRNRYARMLAELGLERDDEDRSAAV